MHKRLYTSGVTTPKRKRPTLTCTVEAEVKARLVEVVRKIPAATLSGMVNEMLKMTLPVMEAVVSIVESAKREDGTLDEVVARERMAAYIGTHVLTLYNTQLGLGLDEEESG
jgi:hypothetical protein